MSDLSKIADLRPKFTMRAWRRRLADQREPLTGDALKAAGRIVSAINAYDLNFGRKPEAEHSAREDLRARLTEFDARFMQSAD